MNEKSNIELLKAGFEEWNHWRTQNPTEKIDFSDIHLGDVKLPKIDLTGAKLDRIRLRWAYMREARLNNASLVKADLRIIDLSKSDLRGADLSGADLSGSYLRDADLSEARLCNTNLVGVNLDRANLTNANLRDANLRNAVLVNTDLRGANLDGCRIYGTSVWNVKTDNSSQQGLVITPPNEPEITVDNLKVAQFVYLILNNQEVRDVINTIGNKGVLILGRFTQERKSVLDALRAELRKRNFIPILFDFEKPAHRDVTETVSTLAHLSKFVVADITDAKSIPQELKAIVPNLPSLPIQPIILETEYEFSMFKDFAGYFSFLPPFRYRNIEHLLSSLQERIIMPAVLKANEINERRRLFEEDLAKR
jgi:uncharacterized protein YjbI with pentapeptide repeats